MRVLLIEGGAAIAQGIELMLKPENFNVYVTDLGEEGHDLAKLYDYDIILLDTNVLDMSAYEIVRLLRNSKITTPILVLSSDAAIEDKVKALGYGADDFLDMPVNKDELIARMYTIVRRQKGHAQTVIATGDLVVNLDQKTVEIDGSRVHLTGKEYQMLELLSLRKGTTLTKEMFLNYLYGGMDEPELKIIDNFISKLRRKLSTRGQNYIETVHGRGYVLREPAQLAIAVGYPETTGNIHFVDVKYTQRETKHNWQKAERPFLLRDKPGDLYRRWNALLDAEGVAEAERPALIAKLRLEVARATRPKWSGRLERGGELATLSAPLFLKRVHADDIAADGIIHKETIRAIDPDLMTAVEAYISQRKKRAADLGDAEGLVFVVSRPPTNTSPRTNIKSLG